MKTVDPRVQALCDEFEIEIIDGRAYPQPGQTRAVATIRRIIDRHGEAHARLVLSTIAETTGHAGLMTEESFWAVSDLVRACHHWVETRTSEWLAAWDEIPMGQFMYVVQELHGVVRQREALAGLCYSWLRDRLDPEAGLTEVAVPPGLARRMDGSEVDKGRPEIVGGPSCRSAFEKLAIGRALLAEKARRPHRGFQEWIRKGAGMSPATARACMRIARAAAGEDVDQAA